MYLGTDLGWVVMNCEFGLVTASAIFKFENNIVINTGIITGSHKYWFYKNTKTTVGYLTLNLISGLDGRITIECPNYVEPTTLAPTTTLLQQQLWFQQQL